MRRDRNAGWRHRSERAAGREANLIFVLPPNVYVGPPVGGDFLVSSFLQIKSNVRFAPKPTELLRCRAKLTRCAKRQSSAQTTANVKSRVASCLNCFRSCCQFRGEVTSDDPVDS